MFFPSVSPSSRTPAAGQLAPGTTSAQVCFPTTANRTARASVWIGLAPPTSPHLAALRVSDESHDQVLDLGFEKWVKRIICHTKLRRSFCAFRSGRLHPGLQRAMPPYPWNPPCKSGSHRYRNQWSGKKTKERIQRSSKLFSEHSRADVSVLIFGRYPRVCSVCRVRTVLWCPMISRYRMLVSSCAVSLPLTPSTFHNTDEAPPATCRGAGGSGTGGWRSGTDVFMIGPPLLSIISLFVFKKYIYFTCSTVPVCFGMILYTSFYQYCRKVFFFLCVLSSCLSEHSSSVGQGHDTDFFFLIISDRKDRSRFYCHNVLYVTVPINLMMIHHTSAVVIVPGLTVGMN